MDSTIRLSACSQRFWTLQKGILDLQYQSNYQKESWLPSQNLPQEELFFWTALLVRCTNMSFEPSLQDSEDVLMQPCGNTQTCYMWSINTHILISNFLPYISMGFYMYFWTTNRSFLRSQGNCRQKQASSSRVLNSLMPRPRFQPIGLNSQRQLLDGETYTSARNGFRHSGAFSLLLRENGVSCCPIIFLKSWILNFLCSRVNFLPGAFFRKNFRKDESSLSWDSEPRQIQKETGSSQNSLIPRIEQYLFIFLSNPFLVVISQWNSRWLQTFLMPFSSIQYLRNLLHWTHLKLMLTTGFYIQTHLLRCSIILATKALLFPSPTQNRQAMGLCLDTVGIISLLSLTSGRRSSFLSSSLRCIVREGITSMLVQMDRSWTVLKGGDCNRSLAGLTINMLACFLSMYGELCIVVLFIMDQLIICSDSLWAAVYLCLFELQQSAAGLKTLGLILARSRSKRPISMEFTFSAMQPHTFQSCGLLVLRFVSMLGDSLSKGSLKSSLSHEICHPDLICELRHSLTHKEMPEGALIFRTKELLLQEIQDKYWRPNFERIQGLLDWEAVSLQLSKMMKEEQPEINQRLQARFPGLHLLNNTYFIDSIQKLVKSPADLHAYNNVMLELQKDRRYSPRQQKALRRICMTRGVYKTHEKVAKLWQRQR